MFFVDWGAGAITWNYPLARQRINEVAKVTGGFISHLSKNSGLRYENLTLIGFSLGAHVVGLTGKKFAGGTVAKIIGVDPAGPLFDVKDPKNRLTADSAAYTECIHSGFTMGIKDPICRADFYINSGKDQPGCVSKATGRDFLSLCSHVRAVEILIEAYNNRQAFYGRQCDSLSEALKQRCYKEPGAFLNDDKNAASQVSGIFSVITNAESPFGRGR